MAPTLDFVSLVVDDLSRSAAFYRDGMGFPAEAVTLAEDHVKIDLENEVSLMLYARDAFGEQFGDLIEPGRPAGGLILSYYVASKDEVAPLISRAAAAGGTPQGIPKSDDLGGYSGYLKDPDRLLECFGKSWHQFAGKKHLQKNPAKATLPRAAWRTGSSPHCPLF